MSSICSSMTFRVSFMTVLFEALFARSATAALEGGPLLPAEVGAMSGFGSTTSGVGKGNWDWCVLGVPGALLARPPAPLCVVALC